MIKKEVKGETAEKEGRNKGRRKDVGTMPSVELEIVS